MSDPVIFVTLRKRAADKGLDNGGNSLVVIYVSCTLHRSTTELQLYYDKNVAF